MVSLCAMTVILNVITRMQHDIFSKRHMSDWS